MNLMMLISQLQVVENRLVQIIQNGGFGQPSVNSVNGKAGIVLLGLGDLTDDTTSAGHVPTNGQACMEWKHEPLDARNCFWWWWYSWSSLMVNSTADKMLAGLKLSAVEEVLACGNNKAIPSHQ